ncbi:MAG TPA: ATP-binding protein [Casimicrobiaceae bacterium]|nr:ATP-binding protein [Casimicrobiaceae bacterium]
MRNGIEPAAANVSGSTERAVPPRRFSQGRLFRKYLLLILTLVSGALLVSGGVSIYFSYQEQKSALGDLQHEKAIAAASRIEQYIRQIEQQLAYAALPQLDVSNLELRRIEFLKLLRQVPEVTDIAWLDASGHEQVAVSRLGMDQIGSNKDRSQEPAFLNAKRTRPWTGPVYFRKETEPYMTISVRSGSDAGPVTIAEVNLKFIWDVVSRIKIGDKGKAYVVDRAGFLVADPDIGLVLRKTPLGDLPHVKAAFNRQDGAEPAMVSKDLAGTEVLVSYAPIESLDWMVFAEQPVSEVYAKLYASILQTGLLLLAGLVISALCALALARGMVRPIRTLADGAQRIGEGDLDQTIVVRTGDELEGLADRFNRMSTQLRESYAGLERKVEERTHELQNALEQQTAISEILRVISSSPTDVQPVLDAVAERAAHLCRAPFARIMLVDGQRLIPASEYWEGKLTGEFGGQGTKDVPLDRTSIVGRACAERRTLHYEDVQPLLDTEFPGAKENMLHFGLRAVLAVPLMRGGSAYGGIFIARHEPGPFAPEEVALVETFAQQAAIAIDNVRLFNETKEALDQQRASGEVLSAISSSIADTKPVFDKILASCERLFGGKVAVIDLVRDDGVVVLGAYHGPNRDEVQTLYPHSSDDSTATGSVIASRAVVQYSSLDQVPAQGRAAFEVFGIKSAIGAPMLWEGKGIGAIWVVRDAPGRFTDKEIALLRIFADQAVIAIQNARLVGEIQQKSRELEVANQHKSAFLASMSHELRTPLNAIIGFSEVLIARLFGELNEKQDDYLKDIHSSGKHLLNLINDVLDLSKVEAGRMDLEPSQFDLPAALADAMTLIRERATKHGIQLALDVAPQLGTITADERKFKQILLNLLSNAVKFTPDGGRVDVKATRSEGGIQIAVSDTGIGIAADDQEAVFEEFRQVGTDYTSKQEGTGLGLALTRRFVELHGGRIWLASATGKGSTFYFTIPDRT